MKIFYYVLLLFFILLGKSVFAQTGINFGTRAGYNFGTQYGIKPPDIPYTVDSDSRNGFSGGIIIHFPITESFSVQQEFLYSNKGSRQHIKMTEPIVVNTDTEYNLNYFELPIVFKYTFLKIKKLGIYGSSGFGLSLLMNGNYTIESVVDIGGGIKIPLEESGNVDGLDTFDYSFLYGIGVDHDLFGKKCFFEYRQTVGWNTLLMPTGVPEEPAPLRNQSYALSLGIYF